MSSPLQLLLMVGPLAWYFYLLAVWQTGRHPRVVSGALDLILLALGISGLVVFGPLGELLIRIPSGRSEPGRRLVWTMLAILVVSILARRSSRRLVIYHVDPEALESALHDSLGLEAYVRTADGFEDREHTRGIRVEVSPRWQSAVISAFGNDADGLIRELGPRLRMRLRTVHARTTEVPLIFFGLAALTMLVPLTGYLLTQPHARAALRGLLEHLRGG